MDDRFFIHFIMSALASSLAILLILLLKKGLKKHISTRWQYNMDLFFFILLTVPFLPSGLLNFMNVGNWLFGGLHLGQATTTGVAAMAGGTAEAANGMGWLQDFTMSVDRASPGRIDFIFLLIWFTGVATLTAFTFICNRKLRLIKESMKQMEDVEIAELFRQCKVELGIKRDILLGTSILVKSPMTIGLFRTRVILPVEIRESLFTKDIRYILLHELTHCKNKDIPLNNLMCLFQILYWFNPLVFFAFREMRLDREMACDLSVLRRLPAEHHVEYGKTLLNFASKLSPSAALSFAADMGGSKRQIKKRIEGIASFVKESKLLRVKSVCIFALMGVFILCQIPIVAALSAYDSDFYHFQSNNVVYEDLSSHFDDYDGSFVLYDLEADQYHIYNREKSVTRVSPDSTYKIYSALIAMDTGVIDTNRSMRGWDGTSYPYEAWNKDQDLMSAMQNSVSWYFQDLDAQIGGKELASYYTRLSYGNHDLTGDIADYWMESSLLISPVEQVELLKDFYQNTTIFKREHVDTLKSILRLSEKDGAVLSGKTGTGSVNGKTINGWFIGYVENNGHTVIFATNIQGDDEAGGSAAVQITLSILKDKGIY